MDHSDIDEPQSSLGSAGETRVGRDETALNATGRDVAEETGGEGCRYCARPCDIFDPTFACTVCREPVLVCRTCRESLAKLSEYHCRQHHHGQEGCLTKFDQVSNEELRLQLQSLNGFLAEISSGRQFKQKRKILQKQIQRIARQLESLGDVDGLVPTCQCGDKGCNSRYGGFQCRKRKQNTDKSRSRQSTLPTRTKKDFLVEEITTLGMSKPPVAFRDELTGIRVPPCSIRVLRCYAKPKWCGQPILNVLKDEFVDMSRPQNVKSILEHGLLRLNGRPIGTVDASQTLLKNGDQISRLVHWHEAPVIVPKRLAVRRINLPSAIMTQHNLGVDCAVFVCDKPSSVPVHPAGPYLANSLAIMVEAQEGLAPASLIPIHRTDRVTSGLVLMCTNPLVSRIFHQSFADVGMVQKLYLAEVNGRFGSEHFGKVGEEESSASGDIKPYTKSYAQLICHEATGEVEVSAPIDTVDPGNGIRAITDKGKPARSRFRLIKYNAGTNTSYVACYPMTGRNHQLRVHLSWLGFPIVGDVQYGGVSAASELESSVLPIMENAYIHSPATSRLAGISQEHVDATRSSCTCCRGGKDAIKQSFTSAQLLLGGHAIHLHAFRYRVQLSGSESSGKCGVAVEYEVAYPSWAKGLESKAIPWLGSVQPLVEKHHVTVK